MPYRSVFHQKHVGCFNCYPMVLITLKLFNFEKISHYFSFTVFCSFCLIVTKFFHGWSDVFSNEQSSFVLFQFYPKLL